MHRALNSIPSRKAAAALLALLAAQPLMAETGAPPLLRILTETGENDDGLPVLAIHPEEARIVARLSTGFIGRILRTYRAGQTYLHNAESTDIEPAYLLLSDNQGGFPRYGFVLEGLRKPGTAYVDLHKSSDLTGRWGAVDQIFPHEMGHILIRQLIGELEGGGANQVHAIALKTDRPTAFNEGFGEHFQVMAIDDPNAPDDTAQLVTDGSRRAEADRALHEYARELKSRRPLGAPTRLRFLFWFSRAEDILRYDGVKENLFAYRPELPADLIEGGPLYHAYLYESIVPGSPDGRRKSPSWLLASEGVVSTFFYRWATHAQVRLAYRPARFYETFGLERESVGPIENAYLKLLSVFATRKPQNVLEFARGYQASFPEERAAIDEILGQTFFDSQLEAPPEIWLANQDFETGTTLFDQFKGIPRQHTFDLNAASLVDLMSIPGMTIGAARSIERALPVGSFAQISGVPGVTPEFVSTFNSMRKRMEELRGEDPEDAEDLSLETILRPFAYRALTILGIVGLFAAILHGLVRRIPWYRALVNGYAASTLSLGIVWILTGGTGWMEWLTPFAAFGLPACLWKHLRSRDLLATGRTALGWILALIPSAIALRPW